MRFLSLLKSPRVLIGVLCVLLLVALYTLAARLGLTLRQQILIGIGIALLFIIAQLVISLIRKRKQSAQLEQSLVIEANAHAASGSDAEKQRREAARRELLEALAALKRTPMAGGGKSALRALPWYLVLGRNHSGRSTLIQQSGLQLPGQQAGELKGIGASRYCDWWFTSQGLLLEAKADFLEAAPAVGESDWRSFLASLAKVRPEVALQGVILTLAVDALRDLPPAELAAQAALLRRRLDALREILEIECPVYLVLTRADQMHGFAASFEDLDAAGAGQVWGATLPLGGRENAATSALVLAEFDALYALLCERRVGRLTREPSQERRSDIYLFPLELRALRERLGSFIDSLCAPDPYGRRPLLRGFYLTSAAQAGASRETVLTEVSRVVGLGTQASAPPASGALPQSRPYFIRSFFLRALVPDFRLARPTRRLAARLRVRRLGLHSLGFALLGLLGLLLIISFGRNLALISRTTALAESARQLGVSASPDAAAIEQALTRLDPLREQLLRLDRTDRRRSPALGLGLYRGQAMNTRAREIYVDRLYAALLAPSATRFAAELQSEYPTSSEDYQDFADAYRAYRMLIDPEQGDPELLVPTLQSLWGGSSPSERLREQIDAHLRYAWQHPGELEARSAGLPGVDAALARRANAYIRDFWQPDRFYALMIDAANDKVAAFRPADLPGGAELFAGDPEALASGGAAAVPGAFTLAGWRDAIKARILGSDQQLADDWLLREAFGERQASIQSLLLKLYVDDYIAAWTAFFRGVDVAPAAGMQAASQQLARLGDKDSPFLRLLEAAAEQLRLRDDQLSEAGGLDRIETAWAPLHALFVKTKDGAEEGKPVELFLADFKALTGELEHLRDAENPAAAAAAFTRDLMQAAQDESAVTRAMQRARRHVNRVEGGGLPACNEALGKFLQRPAQSAWRACLAETTRHLDSAWQTRVYEPFNQTLDRRYPFYPSGPDASLDDFSNFFGPRGILAEFNRQELAAYRGPGGEPILRHGLGLQLGPEATAMLERAQRYQEIFFRDGGDRPKLRFELLPGRPQLVSGRDPVVEATRFTLDNNRLLYEMGHPQPREFVWPGEGERREASLALRCSKAGPEPLSAEGSPWGLFKLLEKARVESIDGRRLKVTWTLEKSGDCRVAVPYELRAASAVHPFGSGFFEFRCPARLSP